MTTVKTMHLPTNGSSNVESQEDSAKTSLKKQFQCGSCEGLVREKVLEARCADLGKLPVSRACGSHRPDVFTLANSEEKVNLLSSISEVMMGLGTNDLQILAGLMLSEKATRRAGFKFHQKVYVRVQGQSTSNYLSNFAVGYVLSATKEHVKVIGESGTMAATFLNDKDSITLYTVAQFNPIRREMVENKRYIDPEIAKTIQAQVERSKAAIAAASIKTFDAAVEEGLVKKTKRSERGDLVALVSRLGKGHLKVDKADKPVKKEKELSSGSVIKFQRH